MGLACWPNVGSGVVFRSFKRSKGFGVLWHLNMVFPFCVFFFLPPSCSLLLGLCRRKLSGKKVGLQDFSDTVGHAWHLLGACTGGVSSQVQWLFRKVTERERERNKKEKAKRRFKMHIKHNKS